MPVVGEQLVDAAVQVGGLAPRVRIAGVLSRLALMHLVGDQLAAVDIRQLRHDLVRRQARVTRLVRRPQHRLPFCFAELVGRCLATRFQPPVGGGFPVLGCIP